MTSASLARRLASPAPPWVHLFLATDGAAALPSAPPDFISWILEGRRCRTKRALLDELEHVLGFPAHFGRTWDALEDCLTDLGWLPGAGYRLVVRDADRLLARDPTEYATFVTLLEDVGRAWATAATGHPDRSALPFHTVLVVPAHRLGTRPSWGVPRLTG